MTNIIYTARFFIKTQISYKCQRRSETLLCMFVAQVLLHKAGLILGWALPIFLREAKNNKSYHG